MDTQSLTHESEPTLTWVDGLLVDEHGEIHQHEAPADQEFIEWASQRYAFAVGKRAGIEAEYNTLLEQLNKRYAPKIAAANRNGQYFEGLLEPLLRPIVESQTAGKTFKSIAMKWLRAGFRTKPGSIKVLDKTGAITWAKKNCPEAVKVEESILVTPLKRYAELPEDAFEVVPPSEEFYIKP